MGGIRWTEEQDATLRELYDEHAARCAVDELAAVLGRTETSLHSRAHRLGLTAAGAVGRKRRTRYALWTDEHCRREFEAFKASGLCGARYCEQKGYAYVPWSLKLRQHIPDDEWDAAVEHNWPSSSWYVKGRQLEYAVVKVLRRHGWWPQRTKRSLTCCDVSGMRADLNVLVQCKLNGRLGIDEWNELIDLAEQTGAVPLLATHEKSLARIQWYRLDARKRRGVRQRQPMTPVRLTAAGVVPLTA